MQPSYKFWKTFKPLIFGLPTSPLVHQLVFFPVFHRGIDFISTKFIALATYLGNWTLVAPIIIVRFLSYHHSFLLKKDKCQQFWSIPFIGQGWHENSFPWMWWLAFPLHVVCKERIRSTSKNHFKHIAQAFLLQHHL